MKTQPQSDLSADGKDSLPGNAYESKPEEGRSKNHSLALAAMIRKDAT
jgi:hypothetical protein